MCMTIAISISSEVLRSLKISQEAKMSSETIKLLIGDIFAIRIRIWIIAVVFTYLLSTNYGINAEPLPDNNGPLSEVQTAVGLDVSLPCDLMPGTMASDKVQLVIWYKEGKAKPIYTFDARGKPLQQAVHWADIEVLKNKSHFYYDSNPPALRIRGIQEEDAGLYGCRVDFHKTPTRNWRINLKVLVPPTRLIVLDTSLAEVTANTVGPYQENTSVNLTCISYGGSPTPRVSWWKEHALLDDSFETLIDGTVKNVLHLHKLSRADLNSVYTCQASNGHVLPPLSKTVKLDMTLQPLFVRLQGLNHPLVAGVRTHITCSSAGARPAPQIIWHKGGVIMRNAQQSTSSDGNVTISELVFSPEPEDNEKQVTCSVSSEALPTETGSGTGSGLFLKDSRILDVRHAPIVSLNFGSALNANNLKKGSDVYLECDIKSNPPTKKVEWYHNNQQLYASRGVIISNQTLVLQKITKSTHGQYFCRASNLQGSVSSNEVYVDVKYPPVCKYESTVIRAALKQTIHIACEVDSNPMQNISYKWHFNNSLESIVELPPSSPTATSIIAGGNANNYVHAIPVIGRHGRMSSLHSSNGGGSIRDVNRDNDDNNDDDDVENDDYEDNGIATPNSQMVYTNLVNKNQFERNRKYQQEHKQHKQHINSAGSGSGNSNDKKKQPQPLNNVYEYFVESYESFGAVSCVAENVLGQSQPCWYHIQPADLPDAVKNCTAYNATANSIQIQCLPGYDGGIQQHFHVQVYDELNRQILYNTSYKFAEFTIKRLPSDSVFVIRVTSINLQGPSKQAFRLRARTLSAPLLRTASSTAVLVQLTPLLGALVGVMATLILVAICIVIFIKFRTKHSRNGADPTTTETDKGSAEPLSRNMGSHSSLEDKNPDVVPQENSEDEFHLEEKAFDRLNMESQRILYTPPRLNSASPPPLSPTFIKQYGELSLTTNPSFALYNTPLRAPAQQRPIYTDPPPLLSTRSPPNIYTRIPGRTFMPTYETRTSPTSPYGTATCASTLPLLQQTDKLPQQPANMHHHHLHQQHSLLIANGSSILGNYDDNS